MYNTQLLWKSLTKTAPSPRHIHGTVGLKPDVAGEGGQQTNDGIHEDPWHSSCVWRTEN